MWSVLGVFLPTRVLQVSDSGTEEERAEAILCFVYTHSPAYRICDSIKM